MIMMGLKFMDDVPFRDVYIHALVRDAEGKKMSKSKGNVIDPLHVMNEFGTDALRFTLASMASPGRDVKLAEERIEGYRNFANKIWNAARFAHMYLDGPQSSPPVSQRTIPDRWILSRLNHTIKVVTAELEGYRFDRASNALYHFIWHEFCDWYLELIKPVLQAGDHPDGPATRTTLIETMETTMRLLHPFMPFITEELWQTFPHQGHSIVIQSYPREEPSWDSSEAEQLFTLIEQTVNLARTGRVLLNYPPGQHITYYLAHEDTTKQTLLNQVMLHAAHLSRGTCKNIAHSTWSSHQLLTLVTDGLSVGIEVSGEVDLQKALDRLDKQISEVERETQRLSGKLNNPDFVSKAPPEVITDHQDRLRSLAQDTSMLISSERQLRSMLGLDPS
jgi:valyl-tRNA synthetase